MNSLNEEAWQGAELIYISIDKIEQNPQQPRFGWNDKKLVALADSVKNYGVLEPVLVCQRENHLTLIAGHRRLAAATIAGLTEIPVRILPAKFIDDLGAAAITENMLRVDLNTLEVAMAIGVLVEGGAERKALCVITGLSSPSVSELLRLNKIPRHICIMCIENGHTTKKFLNQLSLFDGENKICEAYLFFLENKQLPPRQKRVYGASSKNLNLLKLLNKLIKCLEDNTNIDYLSESEMAEKFRIGIGAFHEKLKKHGWFIPQEFDISNSGIVHSYCEAGKHRGNRREQGVICEAGPKMK